MTQTQPDVLPVFLELTMMTCYSISAWPVLGSEKGNSVERIADTAPDWSALV